MEVSHRSAGVAASSDRMAASRRSTSATTIFGAPIALLTQTLLGFLAVPFGMYAGLVTSSLTKPRASHRPLGGGQARIRVIPVVPCVPSCRGVVGPAHRGSEDYSVARTGPRAKSKLRRKVAKIYVFFWRYVS